MNRAMGKKRNNDITAACTENTFEREKVAFRNAVNVCIRVVEILMWRPFTESSGQIYIVDKCIATLWLEMQLYDTLFFCLLSPWTIPSSNQRGKKMYPTSTQIFRYFL